MTELRLVEPKSDRSYRIASLPASIVPVVLRHRAAQNRERLFAGSRWVATGAVFTTTIGGMLDERNVRREFYILLKSLDVPRIRLHDLRHSFATILLAAGEHPRVVQEMLGHSLVQLTLDTYSHLLPDLRLKERAAARLDALIGEPGKEDHPENCGQNCGHTTQNVVSRGGIVPAGRARSATAECLMTARINQLSQRDNW